MLDDLCALFNVGYGKTSAESMIEEMRMLPGIRATLAGNDPGRILMRLSERLVRMVRDAITTGDSIRLLAIEPEPRQEFLSAIRRFTKHVRRPVLVVSDPALPVHVRKLIEREFPRHHVLSESEVLPQTDDDQRPHVIVDLEPKTIARTAA